MNNKGFTLIELILTISLMSILSYAAIPKSAPLASFNLDASARQIKSDIRYAQNLATTTGENHGFRTTGNHTYEIYNVTTGALATSPVTHEDYTVDMSGSYGDVLFADDYVIEFDTLGRPVTGGGTIVEVGEGAALKQVQVTASSGYVSLLD